MAAVVTLPVGAVARARLRNAVLAAGAGGAFCLLLSVIATQDKALRMHSPWQDDPYDVVVSFSLFILPVLLAAGFCRVPACRAAEAMPVTRARDLLRWARLLAGIAALCVLTEWVSVAVRAHAAAWGTPGAVLIAALAAATAVVGAAGLLVRKAGRVAEPGWKQVAGPDWVDDWLSAARLTAGTVRPVRNLFGWLDPRAVRGSLVLRRHPLGAAAVIALASGLAIALGQGIGEHSFSRPGTAIQVLLLFTLVPAVTQFSFLVAAGAYLGVVRREAARLRFAGWVALRATIIAAASVPFTIGFRFWADPLLHAVGLPGLIAAVAAGVWLVAAAAQLAWHRHMERVQ
jgi:hypothetical protein